MHKILKRTGKPLHDPVARLSTSGTNEGAAPGVTGSGAFDLDRNPLAYPANVVSLEAGLYLMPNDEEQAAIGRVVQFTKELSLRGETYRGLFRIVGCQRIATNAGLIRGYRVARLGRESEHQGVPAAPDWLSFLDVSNPQ